MHTKWTALATALLLSQANAQTDNDAILSIDHYVRQTSSVPSIAGETTQIYVRERVRAATALSTTSFVNRVALFVHGAGTPAEVAFDVPYEDYSWMAYLAAAGFDVFSMDTTGYGRSTRPNAMNDPCNLSEEQQSQLIPELLSSTCKPSQPGALTTIASDWDDIDAVVEYIRELRGVDRVSMLGWSLGGPRAGGYAAQFPDKVASLVLLAPAYDRGRDDNPPESTPSNGAAITKQSREDFIANWNRQVGCSGQYDPRTADAVWSQMLASDPVGATWGPGVRRAPRTSVWGFNQRMVSRSSTPTLMIAAAHDRQVLPERVRDYYADLGAEQKVLLDLGCASHNAIWETVHELMFRASLEWLESGTVNGMSQGIVRMGYE